MNKKIVKSFSCCLLGTCLFSTVLSNGFNGYAVESIIIDDVDISNYVDSYNYQYISKLSNEKAIIYKNALKLGLSNKKLGKQSIDKVIENIDKLAAKENDIPIFEFRGNFWDGQGITTDELGATIDVALMVLTGGAPGGAKAAVQALIAKHGKHKAVQIIASKLSSLGLGAFVSKIIPFIDAFIYLTSPGKGIASFIDSIDFHKDNGRINLWP
ncbi:MULTISPECIES: hypothetical protein [unclassified Granulicatella]|uniref:hypothetical protein n=1 Tax=unclassified Granulicatella TaxID=2630493 RepID=UPI0010736356|nr:MULTISPECIES: hypothetical protein [unclassified Granulicatella]MBF0780381.1 hypothetical protein [Granulicatella sp. 19428wC4_WM01]TFU95469.1 hypothetical protein E4T68_04685 [Granulicatella sp. WM01]